MPPTIQNGTNNQEKRPQRPQDKKSELINRVKYSNTLPDISFDLKFITYPFDNTRFIQYNPTSLERNYRYEVLTEHDLGVTIDLINRDLYQADPYAQLEPADEKLLEEDVHTPQDSLRSKHHAKSVSWLRKSEYISTEQTRFQPQVMEKVEAKVGYNVKKSFVEETLYMDRDAQIKAIQKTFDETKTEIKNHYSKPNVTAVEVHQIFPDFTNWKYPCAQVIFDSDPAEAGKNVPAQIEEMSQAMIRGVMDESGEQFVAYFLPTEDTLQKRRKDFQSQVLYEDDEEYEYKMAREYNWNVKSKASKGYEENYFLVVRPEGIYYNELETRVRLNKRRQKVGQPPTSTKLVVKHLPLNATEHRMQRYRERQLEPTGEDDEEEMEENHEEDEAEANEDEIQEEKAPSGKNDEQDKQSERSRSRSRSKSGSRSRSRSHSKSDESRSGSQTPDHENRSRSRAKNGSKSRSRSASSDGSPRSRRSKSRSVPARSVRSMSRGTNKSRRTSKSGSRSRSRSVTGSPASKGSRSRSRSVSRSKSRSRSASHSPARSRASRSMSRATKASSHHSRSKSRSRSASGSRTPSRSRSRSRSKSGSRSGTQSPSGSRSRSHSKSRSRSGSPSPRRSASRSGSESASE